MKDRFFQLQTPEAETDDNTKPDYTDQVKIWNEL